ncbi:hypothetical protein T06_9557 [Trichinella sp. T6]|nr:hypothetical protein T06_9557 [Trichinella sp. T6]
MFNVLPIFQLYKEIWVEANFPNRAPPIFESEFYWLLLKMTFFICINQKSTLENMRASIQKSDFVTACPAVTKSDFYFIRLSMARIANPVAWPEVVDISGHGCSTSCFEPDPMMENKRQYLR